jgi:hypothetical protein
MLTPRHTLKTPANHNAKSSLLDACCDLDVIQDQIMPNAVRVIGTNLTAGDWHAVTSDQRGLGI